MGHEVMVKGQSFHAVLQAFEDLRGTDFRARALAEMPDEGGEALREGFLLSANYYPVAWYRALLGAGVRLASGARDFAREVGLRSGQRDIAGIYKILFRALSTEMVIRQSGRLFRIVYRGGNIQVSEVRSGFARVSYSECYGFDRNVWQDALGGAEACFRATGARQLTCKVESGGDDGHSSMVVQVHWA